MLQLCPQSDARGTELPNQMQLIQESLKVLERDAFSTSSWGSQVGRAIEHGKGASTLAFSRLIPFYQYKTIGPNPLDLSERTLFI